MDHVCSRKHMGFVIWYKTVCILPNDMILRGCVLCYIILYPFFKPLYRVMGDAAYSRLSGRKQGNTLEACIVMCYVLFYIYFLLFLLSFTTRFCLLWGYFYCGEVMWYWLLLEVVCNIVECTTLWHRMLTAVILHLEYMYIGQRLQNGLNTERWADFLIFVFLRI